MDKSNNTLVRLKETKRRSEIPPYVLRALNEDRGRDDNIMCSLDEGIGLRRLNGSSNMPFVTFANKSMSLRVVAGLKP